MDDFDDFIEFKKPPPPPPPTTSKHIGTTGYNNNNKKKQKRLPWNLDVLKDHFTPGPFQVSRFSFTLNRQ